MKRSIFSGLQIRLFLLILLAIVPTAGVILYTSLEERREHIELARQETMRLALLAALYQERVIENTGHLLGVLSRLPEVRTPGSSACGSMLAGHMSHFTVYTNLGVADLSGNVVCSGVPLVNPVNIADRSYFKRALEKDGFAVGDFQVGRITGEPAVNFGYPVKDGLGKAIGVVYAALGAGRVGPAFDGLDLPEGATVSIIDSQGTLLFRHPETPGVVVGEKVPMEPDVKAAMAGLHGGIAEAMSLDGLVRIFAIVPLHNGPKTPSGLYLRLGVPKDHVLASTHLMTMRNLVVLAAGILLAFGAAWMGGRQMVVKPVRSLVGVARRLAEGDLRARWDFASNVREVEELGGAFDEMASAIEGRERELEETLAELRQAEVEVRRLNAGLEKRVAERTAELKAANRHMEQANEKLREMDRLKSVFIASMNHELIAPLNSIIGFSDILLNEWPGPLNEQQRENVGAVLRSGRHLLSLITDIIDVSKIEAGKTDVIISTFDLHDTLNEAISVLKKDMEGKGLVIKVEASHLNMATERRRLLQCLINLIGNAVKYTERGEIRIRNSEFRFQNKDYVEIAVEDTGIGIRKEDMPRLFSPFVRLDSPLTTKVGGTGLGLYLTRKLIVEVLKGEITATSEYGQGSRFVMRVPVTMEGLIPGVGQ